jgi:hypothetical protein
MTAGDWGGPVSALIRRPCERHAGGEVESVKSRSSWRLSREGTVGRQTGSARCVRQSWRKQSWLQPVHDMALVGAQEVLPDCRASQRLIASGSYDNGSYSLQAWHSAAS